MRAGGVAAGIGDEPAFPDLLAVDFDEAVDRLALKLRRVMGIAVPARIGGGVGEAEVGGEIDHLHPRRLGEQLL